MNKNIYEIELKEIIKIFLKNIKSIISITFISLIMGTIYSFSLKNIYTASTTFYPHYQEIESNSLRNLAGLAGINFQEQNNNDVPPSLYPNLISSTPFKISLLNTNILFKNKLISYKKYLLLINPELNENDTKTNNYEENIDVSEYFVITKNDYILQKQINKVININVNSEDGYIILSGSDNSPDVAAQITKKSKDILQEMIINYKLKNIKSLYDFTVKQLEQNKLQLYELQDSLASFRDNNKNIKSDLFLNQLNRLENEVSVSSSIYNELSLNKEKTAIEVKKNTPIFTVLEPVTLPIDKSYPKRLQIIITFGLIGFFFSSIYYMITKLYINIL